MKSPIASRNIGRTPPRPANDVRSGSKARTIEEVRVGDAILGYRALERKLAGGRFDHFLGRMREIEKLIRHRHGQIVPETDDADIYADAIAALAYVKYGADEIEAVMTAWCGRWMPWAAEKFVDEIIYERLRVQFRLVSADALGNMLRVTYAERCELDLRTIGACDVTKRQRTKIQKKKRRAVDRARKKSQRRLAGSSPREVYLANALTQSQPWRAFGISRRTWERRGKPHPPIAQLEATQNAA
jgi:hypothetical protein